MQRGAYTGKEIEMDFFENDTLSALEAKEKAQWIAFGPVVFQTARVLRNTGILQVVADHTDGITLEDVVTSTGMSLYGVRVLMEAALGMGLMTENRGVFKATKTAMFILHDKLTQVNMDFIHDVCYNGLFFLDESIAKGRPEGLRVFGQWPTIYEALSKLSPEVQKSWFGFDHYYSDVAFPQTLPHVFKYQPKTLLDIGGNTGKWSLQCFEHDPNVVVTIMDLPGQVGMAREQIAARGFSNRIRFCECNILDESQPFPKDFDAIWMSQFLDCFSDDEIRSILRRCRSALSKEGRIFILEPFWDRQKFRAAAFSLQQTSLYFTAMANGNSQMYHSANFIRFIEDAGLKVESQHDGIGVSHTLLTCQPR
jgi:ubiquinone/menaquinone biosynthesis C-methylase UbiE